ncbi:MAG: MFS transporter [Pseudomonadota bacterium]
MFKRIWAELRMPPAAAEKITDPQKVASMYRYWRWRTCYASFVGYAVFYLMRKNISTVLPAMSRDLGYSNTQLGILGAALYISYGVGKFVNGVLADRANIRYFSVIGMFGSVVCSVLFGYATSLFMLAFIWGLNGWFQSMGNPPYARALAQWFNVNERGRIWGVWSTAHQVGTLLVRVLTAALILKFSWRSCFFVPAFIGFVASIFLYNRMRDRPEAMGLPPVEKYDKEKDIDYTEEDHEEEEYEHHYWQAFLHKVLFNKWIWLCAFINIFVYVVRFGADDWAPKLMVELKGNTDSMGALMSAANPLVGILGMIIAGWVSDKLFAARRGPASAICMFLLAACICIFYKIPPGHPVLDFTMMGLIGFFTYGPQLLIAGVASVDFGSKRMAASATGFIGLFGYVGAVLSSAGTGVVVDRWGWGGGAKFWAICALAGGLLTLLMWKAKPKTA